MQSAQGVNSVFLQYGALGAFAIIAIIFFFKVWKRESDRADKAQAEKDALNKDLKEQVIPLLTDCVRALAQLAELIRERRL